MSREILTIKERLEAAGYGVVVGLVAGALILEYLRRLEETINRLEEGR
jgi:hypothetical protein